MLCLLLVTALALVGPAPRSASVARSPAPRPLAHALRDADGDRRPDRVGETVTVGGRASVGTGGLGDRGPSLFIQDATGGIRLDRPVGPHVALGDSVVATGRLVFRDGLAVLDRPRLRRVEGPGRAPEALPYSSGEPESVEGRLVTVDAVVAGLNPVEAGDALLLSLPDGKLLVAFVFGGRDTAIPLHAYAPGDRVRVVGVAGQYDGAEPYRDSYQIYPRTTSDLDRLGFAQRTYRFGAYGAVGLLALLGLAILWVERLRHQVARRRAELRRSQDRYLRLFEAASDAVLVHDSTGTEVEMNAAARRAFGLPEVGPMPRLGSIVHPDSFPAARAHMTTLAETGHARTDLRVVRTDGVEGIYEFDSQTLDLDGRPRVLSLARDVGARRAYEQGLIEAREAAEEMVRVKSSFLASMSHEIRTPLTAVIGYAELLREEVAEEQIDLVEAIEAGGQRLLSTLNSVLDLARLDADRETLRPIRLDLVSQIGQSVHLLGALAARKRITLTFAPVPESLWACLDAGALDRVLINLVGNAVKFTDLGGVTVMLDVEDGSVVLTVTDTGIGMSTAFLPDVFNEFRQESEGEARSHEGTGLGLAITQRLVGLMGGSISVESALGVGTTFTVTLPLDHACGQAPEEAPKEPEAQHKAALTEALEAVA